jgi:uncharacterized DUF497 family protein
MIYQWNAWNLEHIGKHGVKPVEAEYVVDHARTPFPRGIGRDKQLVWGKTESGRYLQVIFVYLSDDHVDFSSLSPLERLRFESGEDEVGLIIHARDMTADQKRQYRRLMRQ